ncbi:hypothetical protein ONZ51_g5497 [Trametes cubensis]|uniref:HMG box domain-containing protein n=1 Tax=Trametes cubensis TaxID=1111947 RepID=A0AAD7XDL3_9APHY|nr:hypothetical protein ONZ51_g5497 [Trametes cubensis]
MQANRQHTASPFTSPSASPGAMSQPPSDSEWSSEWSMGSPAPSRTTTPALSAGRSTPQIIFTPEQLEHIIKFIASAGGNMAPAINGIERRQQNISRVAGECWNLLPDAEKKKWHDKAKEVLLAHMEKHPDYKFSPERKAARKKAAQDPELPVPEGEDYIRFLREKYTGLTGPAVSPPRQRKPKSRRGVESDGHTPASLPPSLRASPVASSSSTRVPSAPPSLSSSPHSVPRFDLSSFQNYPMPPFPSHPIPNDSAAQYAMHTAQGGLFDDDVTPKASTFGDIALPTQPKYNFPPNLSYPSSVSMVESHLGLQNVGLASGMVPLQGSSTGATGQLQPPVFDRMWDTIVNDSYNHGATSDLNGHSSHEDATQSAFAPSDLNGPMDFDGLNFPALFPPSSSE